MINFPVFKGLDVSGYSLFPGEKGASSGLHVVFHPGLTLFLGANGLGKTTVITMMFRMLTGPFDIPGLTGAGALGTTKLTPSALPYAGRTMFAQRVSDGAQTAIAQMDFTLGGQLVHVERRLSDLSLSMFSIDGQEIGNDDSGSFQVEIPRLAGVWSFGDWIVLLRHLVFYFEDRRELVWDPTAQRQVLRLLLLPADTAKKWAQDERDVLELDSQARNLSATLFSQERVLAGSEQKVSTEEGVRAELATLENLQTIDTEDLEGHNNNFVDLDQRRELSRLRVLTAEQERESRYRELERAKLIALDARFPSQNDTGRYILAQLMTEANCLVCGNHVPATAADLEERIKVGRCVVCGSDVGEGAGPVPATEISDRRVKKESSALAEMEVELDEAKRQLMEVAAEHDALVAQVAQLSSQVAHRSARIDSLVRRLPPEESELHEQRSELAMLRGRLEMLRAELGEKRQAFGDFLQQTSRTIVLRSGEIQSAFGHHAEEFLIEECSLIWSPHRARVGQSGDPMDFPAFDFEMTAPGFPSPVRRTGPEQVSESQREFIDLAFRMALIQVAGSNGVGSLVIDAPESSLDVVFVSRAAKVLARFADKKPGNRLVVTSNLVEGQLIPKLLELTGHADSSQVRVVDMFKIAEPTAAVRQLRAEYDVVLADMLGGKDKSLPPSRPSARATRSKPSDGRRGQQHGK